MAAAQHDSLATPPRPTVFLHVGTPKSGTTYLQNILWHNRAALGEAGLLYPGDHYAAHFWAALDLQRMVFHEHENPEVEGSWARLVDEVRDWRGTAVISHEMLAAAAGEQAAAALADLSFGDVHLVLTARDLARQIPASWQEEIKNRGTLDFQTYVAALRESSETAPEYARAFWRMQDVMGILERWAAHLPPDRIHLVTVPPAGAADIVLWERFAGLVGVVADGWDFSEVSGNPSLGVADVDLVRRINLALGDSIDWPTYERAIKLTLVTKVLGARPPRAKFRLPRSEHDWVTARAGALMAGIAATGCAVVGDLAELLPAAPAEPAAPVHPDHVDPTVVLSAAVETVGVLAIELAESTRLLRDRERELAQARQAMWAAFSRPVHRQLAHRVAYRLPPVRPLLRLAAAVRDRLRPRPDSELPVPEVGPERDVAPARSKDAR